MKPCHYQLLCKYELVRVWLIKKLYLVTQFSTNTSRICWHVRLEKLSKYLSKIMIAAEGVKSKHSTSWKHQEWMISSSILGDPII